MSRSRSILVIVGAVVLVAVAGVYGYILLKDDAPAALGTGDLEQALVSTSTAPTVAGTDARASTPDASTPDASTPDAGAPASVPTVPSVTAADDPSGDWTVSSADSTLGYRVAEVLGGVDTEGAGRTNQVSGTLTIDDSLVTAAEFAVDMASITSDSERRDNQFRTRIMSTDQFPEATFVLTEPIDFGAAPIEGTEITATATGDLTLRGVTRSVTFDVSARLDAGRIGVLGSIPILFSDYAIPDPSNGFAVVKDNGLLEFVLVFDRVP